MLIDTCISSLYKTVFPSSESFSVDPLTLHCCRILQIIKRAWRILLKDNGFEMSLKEMVKERHVVIRVAIPQGLFPQSIFQQRFGSNRCACKLQSVMEL